MKTVILGGGVAGLAFGAIMQKNGHKVVINERCQTIPLGGNAFMMHEEGHALLAEILGNKNSIPGATINNFTLIRPNNEVAINTKMESWQCLKRSDLIKALVNVIDNKSIKYNRAFSHFIYEGNNAVAAVFENGEVEFGDIFIGADGCNSQVRQLLFGETEFTKVAVQEILGIVKNEALAKQLNGGFIKFQDAEKGLSFGCIPFSENEIIWFNQFDITLAKKPLTSKNDLKEFTKETLKNFPKLVHQILDATDFNDVYLWNTKDFDALSTFHSGNVVLIGDAAHISLPFTSAGTTNALFDAMELYNQIENNISINNAFIAYYNNRIDTIKEHIKLGRKLKRDFLYPQQANEIEIPLIKAATINHPKEIKADKLEIVYFTDPICSTCWTIQPQLRKLKYAFGESINLSYVMGGLLPSWQNFNRGGITKPADVALHWQEVTKESGMPIDGGVWLHQPLESSYPPSIAFKAAQIQDIDKAIIFLRRLNELVFLENNNIARLDVIKKAAMQTGLHLPKLLHDMKNKAQQLFDADISYSQKLGIDYLPTFLFKVNDVNKEFMYGNQSFESFKSLILKYAPYTPESPPMKTPMDVFKDYPSITKHEFKYLTNSDDKHADKMLEDLIKFGMIVKHQTKAGSIFLSNTKTRAFFV